MYNKSEIKMSADFYFTFPGFDFFFFLTREEYNYPLYRVFAKLLNFLLIVSHNTDATYSQQAVTSGKLFL